MSIKIHSSIADVPGDLPLPYFQKGYFQSQSYTQFLGYSNQDFFIPFDITGKNAISIPRSPFGSVFCRTVETEISSFTDSVCEDLKVRGLDTIEVHHPSSIYGGFVDDQSLVQNQFQVAYDDVNQHIELSSDWKDSIHQMQKRKLESLLTEGFQFRKMEESEFETAHKFLTICRQAQGLQVNIAWNQLNHLITALPCVYECFGVFRDEKISALCIAVNVTSEVAYYYLPATSPMFRSKSPMVLLLSGMVNYYHEKGFKYLDLGVSSFQGKEQETLKIFKERMGAVTSRKPTLIKHL